MVCLPVLFCRIKDCPHTDPVVQFNSESMFLNLTEGQAVNLAIDLSPPASYSVSVFVSTEDALATGN